MNLQLQNGTDTLFITFSVYAIENGKLTLASKVSIDRSEVSCALLHNVYILCML